MFVERLGRLRNPLDTHHLNILTGLIYMVLGGWQTGVFPLSYAHHETALV